MARAPICPALVAVFLAASGQSLPARLDENGFLRRQAFELAYNLQHEPALALLRRAVAADPDDPANHRGLAAVLWLTMIFQRGALTVDHYLGSFSRTQVELSQPPPALDAEFRAHVTRAIQLAEARVRADPSDPQARFDLGAAVALQASHIATVQGRMIAGVKAARRAFDEHEKVLALDGSRKDAGLIVATYRYLVSTLSVPLRMMAYVVGFGGGRERGIRMLEETAAAGHESRTDAMFALVLIYNRERRFDDAASVLEQLRKLYPRNRLVLLELGATALRAGRAAQADAWLTEGLAMLPSERQQLMPGEEALWLYKRGAARVMLRRFDEARADLEVATRPPAQSWVSGRAHVELARMAIKRSDQATAMSFASRAEALCKQGNDPSCIREARKLTRNARGL